MLVGYQRLGQNVTQGQNDAHEGLDLMRELPRDHRLVRAGIHHGDCNQWPAAAPALRDTLDEYVAAMSGVGAAIMSAVAMGLGLAPDFFGQFYREGFWIARMILYPGEGPDPQPEPEPELEYGAGCGEHTDYGCLTMVLADDTPGCLQVRAADGSCALPLPSLVGHSAA